MTDLQRVDNQRVAAAPGPRTRRDRRRQLLRFGVVGALGTVVNIVILHVLHNELGFGFTRSSAIATELAILHNYVGNELWTFDIRKLDLRRFGRYQVSSLLGIAVTVVVATLVKELVDPRAAQLIGILCGAGLNYLINAHWTWGPAAAPDAAAKPDLDVSSRTSS